MIWTWALHRRILTARARELSTSPGSVLVVAPHPDDETIGAGGLIALARKGNTDVDVLIVTDGSRSHATTDRAALVATRRQETLEACRRLGVVEEKVRFLDLPDQAVAEHGAQLVRALDQYPEKALIVGPCAVDANPDHRATAELVRQAARGRPGAVLLEYPVWYWHRWAWMDPSSSRPSRLVQLGLGPLMALRRERPIVLRDPASLARKRVAIEAHASQIQGFDGDDSALAPGMLEAVTSQEIFFLHQHRLDPV